MVITEFSIEKKKSRFLDSSRVRAHKTSSNGLLRKIGVGYRHEPSKTVLIQLFSTTKLFKKILSGAYDVTRKRDSKKF